MVGRVDNDGVVHPIFNQNRQYVAVHSITRHVRVLDRQEIHYHKFRQLKEANELLPKKLSQTFPNSNMEEPSKNELKSTKMSN